MKHLLKFIKTANVVQNSLNRNPPTKTGSSNKKTEGAKKPSAVGSCAEKFVKKTSIAASEAKGQKETSFTQIRSSGCSLSYIKGRMNIVYL